LDKIIAEGYTKESGRIFYRVIGDEFFGIRIEQERGILKTAEIKNITQSYEKIRDFAQALAKGNVTSVALFGMCDDFLDADILP